MKERKNVESITFLKNLLPMFIWKIYTERISLEINQYTKNYLIQIMIIYWLNFWEKIQYIINCGVETNNTLVMSICNFWQNLLTKYLGTKCNQIVVSIYFTYYFFQILKLVLYQLLGVLHLINIFYFDICVTWNLS